MIFKVRMNLLDQLGIVSTLVVQPEHSRRAGSAGAINRQLDPVADRQVFGLARAPDIALFHVVLGQNSAIFGNHTHNTVFLDFEGLVVGAILFGFLRHQTYVWHCTHSGGIECTVSLTEVNRFLIDGGVGGLRHNGLGVLELAISGPHFTGVADHCRHGGVNNHVARHVQVGDTFDGVNHSDFRAVLVGFVQSFLDFFLLGFRQQLDFLKYGRQAVVRVYTDFFEQVAVLIKQLFVVNLHRVTEHDRVGDFHHGGFDVQGKHHTGLFAIFDDIFEEFAERFLAHEHAVEHFAFQQGQIGFEHGLLAAFVLENDTGVGRLVEGQGLFVGVKIATTHVCYMGT